MNRIKLFLLFLIGASCVVFAFKPVTCLLLGVLCSPLINNSFKHHLSEATTWLLKASVIGIGFGLTASDIAVVSGQTLGLIAGGVIFTVVSGFLLSKLFKLPSDKATLIVVGTAICGGSAIAAISPILKANRHHIASALTVVFLLNGLAMLIFPLVGHSLGLSDSVFGLWAGLAIHDTSSVIGASAGFSEPALKTAVVVKSLRTLFIVPVALVLAWSQSRSQNFKAFPYFLMLFLVAVGCALFVPDWLGVYPLLYSGAKHLIVVPMFLLGTAIAPQDGLKQNKTALGFAALLWGGMSITSLVVVNYVCTST